MATTGLELLQAFAAQQGLERLGAEEDGSYRITIGAAEFWFYAAELDTMLLFAPLGPFPSDPPVGLVVYLLEQNMFASDLAPFHVGIDKGGNLVLWGRIPVGEVTPEQFAGALDAVSTRVEQLQDRIAGQPVE